MTDHIRNEIAAWVDSEYGNCPVSASELLALIDAQATEIKQLRAELAKPVERVEPAAWRTFDGEGGYMFRAYEDNEDYQEWWEKRNQHHKGWVEPLYLHPPTPAWNDAPEVAALKAERDATMKDAERLDYLQKHARCDPKMDGNHVWWPTTFNQAQNLRGETLREAIDAAIAKAEGRKE